MLNPELKEKIKNYCQALLQQKVMVLQEAMKTATEAANSETKSSVGDKHETARAMMQLEQEKLSKQLSELRDQQKDLLKLNTATVHSKITKGSLVETDNGVLFISIGLGKITISGEPVYLISEQSPLGKTLSGLTSGSKVEFKEIIYSIRSVQ